MFVSSCPQVSFRVERDIFEFLGLAFREPRNREVDATWLAETAPRAGLSPRCEQSHPVSVVLKDEDGEILTELDESSDKADDVEVIGSDSDSDCANTYAKVIPP